LHDALPISPKQWIALKAATGIEAEIAALAAVTGLDLDAEGNRYAARDAIAERLAPWFAARTLREIEAALAGTGVSWGPYRSFAELATGDPRVTDEAGLFATVRHPGGAAYRTPASPLGFTDAGGLPPLPAPALGEHTDEILGELGMTAHEIGRLHDRGIVAGG